MRIIQHPGIKGGKAELVGVDDTDHAAPHPAWVPWGKRDKGSSVGAALLQESRVLPCLPSQ